MDHPVDPNSSPGAGFDIDSFSAGAGTDSALVIRFNVSSIISSGLISAPKMVEAKDDIASFLCSYVVELPDIIVALVPDALEGHVPATIFQAPYKHGHISTLSSPVCVQFVKY
jgi:hypothetical protein